MSWVLLWQNNAAGGNIAVSENWEVVTGQSMDEALQDGWLAIIHPDDRAAVLAEKYGGHVRGEVLVQRLRMRMARGVYVGIQSWSIRCSDGCYHGFVRPVDVDETPMLLLLPDTTARGPDLIPPAFVTMAEAAAHVGLSIDTLYRYVKRPDQTWARRTHRKWLVDLPALIRALRP